jgi:predicted nucleotidyltransferase
VFEAGRWDGRTVREWLPAVVSDIVEAFRPVRIIAFGSVARGTERRDSDIDLLVVVDRAPLSEKRKLRSAIRHAVSAPVPLDVHVSDPEEICRRGNLRGSMLCPALQEGLVVYARPA